MAKKNKLSTEEMAKTQVINLEDVQKLASYEKLISKKPALVVALVGLLAVLTGLSAQAVVSLSEHYKKEQTAPQTQTKIVEEKESGITYSCSKTDVVQASEMSIKLTYEMTYDQETNIITNYNKTTEVLPTSTTSPTALQNIKNGIELFKTFTNYSITGYQIKVENYKTGYLVTVTADNTKINPTLLNPALATNQYLTYDIPVSSTIQQISANLKGAGYTCK